MNIILKSGYVIRNIKPKDNTENIIGLWVWSTKQATDQLLTFENVTVRSSEIAAIENYEENISYLMYKEME